ncbi:MAG TPA: DUF362 domain-containing protein [Pirellulales bacterium]|nr:DUF362 domain-containing protein [Pirellulales bacterium]
MMHLCSHRRRFLSQVGGASLATGLASGLILPKLVLGDESATDAKKSSADVGIARGSNMEEAVRKAVELSGGMGFIKEGQTVLIKPNVTGAVPNPTTTSPEVLYAVIKLVSERGPKRIIVADRSFSPLFVTTTPKTVDVMQAVGQLDAVNQAISDVKAPVVAVGLEDCADELEMLGRKGTDMWRKIKPAKAEHWPNGFELAELLFAVDHVINVPVIKTHFQAWFTMSMKAFVGMSHHRTRLEFHRSFKGNSNLADQKASGSRRRLGPEGRQQDVEENEPLVNRVAELNLGITPALNILDGTKSFVFGGPSHGDTESPKCIVASRDRVAADATGVAVLKRYGTERRLQRYSVWENPFIRHGIKIGLGISGRDQLNLKHSGMDDDIKQIEEGLV